MSMLKKIRGRFPVPGSLLLDSESLLHLIQFHAVASMYVFVGKDNHAGGRGVRHTDDHDLAHSPTRQVSYVNHGTVPPGKHGRIERRKFLLRIFGECGLER